MADHPARPARGSTIFFRRGPRRPQGRHRGRNPLGSVPAIPLQPMNFPFPFRFLAAGCLLAAAAPAQDTGHQPVGDQIVGPGDGGTLPAWVGNLLDFKKDRASDREAWLRDLKIWRAERRTRMGYDDAEYRRPEF